MAQPHDALFKYVLGKPEHAASQMRAVLPTKLADRMDLDSMEQVPASFVDEELTHRHCDVLMRTRWDGHGEFVYTVIEHQSGPDRMMPLRMLRYTLRIWDSYLRDNPTAKRLPLIVPLVVYQGPRRWTHPVELSELLDVDPDAAWPAGEFLPRFRFLLDDLTTLHKTALRARPLTIPVRLTVRLLKIVPAHPSDVIAAIDPDDIADFRHLLRHYPDWRELMAAYLTYIQTGSETPPHRLAWLAAQIGPEVEEVYMSTADMLRTEGRTEEAAKLLLRLLAHKFPTVPDQARNRIEAASVEQLEAWCARVLDAETLDAVFD